MAYTPTHTPPTTGLAHVLEREVRFGTGGQLFQLLGGLSQDITGLAAAAVAVEQRLAPAELAAAVAAETAAQLLRAVTGLSALVAADVVLALTSSTVSVSAATLNTTPAGALVVETTAQLKTAADVLHAWANFDAAAGLATAETAGDAQIAAPTVISSTLFANGALVIRASLDTDAGATKTYVNGDSLSVTLDLSAAYGPLLAVTSPVTFTINVVA